MVDRNSFQRRFDLGGLKAELAGESRCERIACGMCLARGVECRPELLDADAELRRERLFEVATTARTVVLPRLIGRLRRRGGRVTAAVAVRGSDSGARAGQHRGDTDREDGSPGAPSEFLHHPCSFREFRLPVKPLSL